MVANTQDLYHSSLGIHWLWWNGWNMGLEAQDLVLGSVWSFSTGMMTVKGERRQPPILDSRSGEKKNKKKKNKGGGSVASHLP